MSEAVEGEFDLDGELDGVEQSRGGLVGDAVVEQSVLDFHDGDHDGLGALEDGEFDAVLLVGSEGAGHAGDLLLTLLPAVVEVASGLVTESGRSAEDSVGLDV